MKTPGPIRVCVIGAGLMGRWHAAEAARAGARVVAIVDPDLERARRLGPGIECHASIEAFLNRSPEVDAAHVCTPLETHAAIAEELIQRRIHALIEKPLTDSAAEAEALIGRAAEAGTIVCPVHQFLFQRGVLDARQAIPKLGRIVEMNAVFHSAGGDGTPESRLDDIVAEILPHPLSLLQGFLNGGLDSAAWTTSRPAAGELRALGTSSETALSIVISMSSRPPVCAFEIKGSAGTLRLDLFHGFSILETGSSSRASKIGQPFKQSLSTLAAAASNLGRRAVSGETAYPGLRRLVRLFYKSIRNGLESPIPVGDVIAVARARDLLLARDQRPQ
jgi:predicted dehydrogenase